MPLIILILLVGYFVLFPGEITKNPISSHNFSTSLVMQVEVTSLVKKQRCYESFTVKPLDQSYYFQASWFSCDYVPLHVGDILKAHLKLKPMHALNNPGGFDTLQWASQNNIVAQATIKSAEKIGRAHGIMLEMEGLREKLDELTRSHLKDPDVKAVIESLTLGISQNIAWETLQFFNLSGTRHLLSISGSHIAMVAMLAYFLFFSFTRVLIIFFPRINAHTWALALSVVLVAFYVSISGQQLPTLRALWMALLGLAAIFFNRYSSLMNRIVVAAIVVILMDHQALYSPSFYLSFYAVFLIAYHQLFVGKKEKKWRTYLSLNVLLLIGLMPISLYFFSQFSFIALIANLFAIPWVGFILLPGGIFLQWLTYFGFFSTFLWELLEKAAQIFIHVLAFFAKITVIVPGLFITGHLNLLAAISLSILILLAFLPKGSPGKWLCVLALIPLLLPRIEPDEGHAQITFLNVGQGLSILVKTRHHLLVYDTGPRFFTGGDIAQSVTVPFFYYQGWKRIDKMIVSHGDSDHSGGANTLRKIFSVAEVLSSDLKKVPGAALCRRGQHWEWDGVSFRILYPDMSHQHQGNNSSCVLKIASGKKSVLLLGDIEEPAEAYLVKKYAFDLSAQLISVPHHGSKTSSSKAFLETVRPEYAVFSYGFLNRFHFPHPSVMARYRRLNIAPLITEPGPVFVEITPEGVLISSLEGKHT